MNVVNSTREACRRFVGRFEPGVWLITTVGFLNSVGFSISLPFVALYLNENRGVSMTMVGLIILATGLVSASVQLYSGALCDRLGRRPLLVVSAVAGAALYGVMAALIGISAPVWAIVLVYAGVRSALVMQRPAIQAMLVDLCPRTRLVEANGLLRVGQNLGWAFGPAVGGFLLAVIPFAALFGFATVMSSLVILLVVVGVRESYCGATEHVSLRTTFSAAKNGTFLSFVLLCFLLFVAMGQMTSTLSVFSVERASFSTTQYGALLTLNGLLVVAFQYPVARLVDRLAKRAVLIIGSLFYALGYFIMGLVGSYAVAIVAMAVITLGEIVVAPTTLAVVGQLSPENSRGRYMGFYGLAETLGISTGPLLGGILLDGFSQGMAVWGTIGSVALVTTLGFHFWRLKAVTQQTSIEL